MRDEVASLIKFANRANIYMSSWTMPTIWGGANLLDMHLRAMQELLQMKLDGKWDWDFVLNLSESDFPIK